MTVAGHSCRAGGGWGRFPRRRRERGQRRERGRRRLRLVGGEARARRGGCLLLWRRGRGHALLHRRLGQRSQIIFGGAGEGGNFFISDGAATGTGHGSLIVGDIFANYVGLSVGGCGGGAAQHSGSFIGGGGGGGGGLFGGGLFAGSGVGLQLVSVSL